MSNRNRNRAHQRNASAVPRPKPAPDPTGRVDIALCRLLETAVQQYAGVDVRAIYSVLAPQINMGISAVVGPRTSVGVTARQAVKAIRVVAKEIHGGNASGNGSAA